jgi:hypothetical protein
MASQLPFRVGIGPGENLRLYWVSAILGLVSRCAGDEYSMGSNGRYVVERSDTYLGQQNVNFPPGTGGGCVYSGPFSESTGYPSHLGPIDSPYGDDVANHYDYNPRCLIRDLNSWFSSRYNTYTNVTDVIFRPIYRPKLPEIYSRIRQR